MNKELEVLRYVCEACQALPNQFCVDPWGRAVASHAARGKRFAAARFATSDPEGHRQAIVDAEAEAKPMQPWKPDDNAHQARRIGKTGEEVNELGSVLFRISIQGIDSIDPSTGKTNRQRLIEESADVLAQIDINAHSIFTDEERKAMYLRVTEKRRQMAEWEEHFQ